MKAGTRMHGSAAARRGTLTRLLGAALLLAGCGGDRRGAVASDTALAPAAAVVPVAPPAVDSVLAPSTAVDAFLRHVETERSADSARVAGGYTADGLRLLASGIEELAARDSAIAQTMRPRLESLRTRADSMQRADELLLRARLASEAFVLASELLQALQEGGPPPALTDRAAEARQAAAAIRFDQPLQAQEDAVRRFFERSAAALRGLVGARTT